MLAVLLGLIYGGELVCKTVMQSFYPLFSTAGNGGGQRSDGTTGGG